MPRRAVGGGRLPRRSPYAILIVLLALLGAAPLTLAADDHPTAVRCTLPSYMGNSIMNRGVTTCVDLDRDVPTLSYGGACVLAAPQEETITLRVEQDPAFFASSEWNGLRADGTPCGLDGWAFGEETVAWSSECALVAVSPATNGFTGTIRVW